MVAEKDFLTFFAGIPDVKGFSIIVRMGADYGKQMSVEGFLKGEKVSDLAAFAEVA